MEDKVFWQDRPVLVTGSTGLLGSWLIPRLVELKSDVVCIIRDWIPRSKLLLDGFSEKVKIVRGDICDQRLVDRVLNEYEINLVFHLAAQTIVGIANANPVSTFESNIKGTWVLLESCRKISCVRGIVIASSDKAYGDQEKLPYTEDMPLRGKYPYDVSKTCADLLAQSYAHVYKLPVGITRCGNFYGGGDLNWNRIVPGTIRSIIRGRNPVIRSNGQLVRDYFYIEDAVEAYLLLARHLVEDQSLHGQAFNFSNEEPISVLDIVLLISKLMGSELAPVILNEPVNEIKDQYLSSEKARNMLGWKARYNIKEGLELTIGWYRNYLSNERRKS